MTRLQGYVLVVMAMAALEHANLIPTWVYVFFTILLGADLLLHTVRDNRFARQQERFRGGRR